ncbi:MAG TPA: glutamate synthase central domain-containing protein, partial [Vitreimonas sp.]|nr:glutamate synthase central domain-containing protein [Vitreimonas sp.]
MRHRPSPSLDDPRYEHDACGVGFVADAGGGRRGDVLPLALAGLAALGHRGAFGADGESSDGAGVSLPLDRDLVEWLAPGLGSHRPAVVQLFVPRGRVRGARARDLAVAIFTQAGIPIARWRRVPLDPSALGPTAGASRPDVLQAIVPCPERLAEAAFERRLVVARRRLEQAARERGFGGLSVPSASSRTVVYKGLVAGDRLAMLYPDLLAPIGVRYAIFHQRYATNTRPEWHLAQPFRHIAHNGEINTVRGNREQLRGRRADPAGRAGRELLEAGPILSPDGSDSLSLDEGLEVLVHTGWDLPTAILAAIPEALALRQGPHPQAAALQRRTAGFIAPWDGPAALVFGDGGRVGALLDRNGLRPLAWAATRDGIVAAASEAGAVPLSASETVRRGRLGPGQMLLVDPGRRLILEDGEAKAAVLSAIPIHDDPHPVHEDEPEAVVAGDATTPHPLRYLAGLDAERARLDIKAMALEGHEPLWSMGDDTPTPARGRVDRRAADHLRQAFAQVTNPPIDPERERAVMDLRVELGRRPSLFAGRPKPPSTLRLERPVVVNLGTVRDAFAGRAVELDMTWDPAEGPHGLEAALDRLADQAVSVATRGQADLLVLSDRSFDLERLPVPSVLATGVVHTRLTAAGLRGRTDLLVDAADVLDVHALAMAIATGATAVHPRLAVELARELAGGRGAQGLGAAETVRN